VVDRLVRLLTEMKGTMPTLPSPSTRAAQGFALATKGIGGPGAAQLLEVAGWIKGAPQVIEPEIAKFNTLRAHLQAVAGAMGVR
jgi:hypothetical protein